MVGGLRAKRKIKGSEGEDDLRLKGESWDPDAGISANGCRRDEKGDNSFDMERLKKASLPPASSPSCNATNHRANNPQDPCLFSPPTDSPIFISSFSIVVVESEGKTDTGLVDCLHGGWWHCRKDTKQEEEMPIKGNYLLKPVNGRNLTSHINLNGVLCTKKRIRTKYGQVRNVFTYLSHYP
ncbi:hypothetical protein LXL04_013395 [Taraxacum kok-saghyz]